MNKEITINGLDSINEAANAQSYAGSAFPLAVDFSECCSFTHLEAVELGLAHIKLVRLLSVIVLLSENKLLLLLGHIHFILSHLR